MIFNNFRELLKFIDLMNFLDFVLVGLVLKSQDELSISHKCSQFLIQTPPNYTPPPMVLKGFDQNPCRLLCFVHLFSENTAETQSSYQTYNSQSYNAYYLYC